ncbi:MAG: Type-1 restriction enzyme EcoKI specificity protein [Firmicutes bacterium ADurb.Bin419]|nr:MAG: Type-1 restriction enzyme EcoKI specificity protein [Firmicutes bacterium ADurb.Bin419]
MSKWEMVRLGDVCEFINGDRGKNYPSSKDFVNEGIPFINAGHLYENSIDFSDMNYISQNRYEILGSGKVEKNDILYCLRGSLGKHALVNIDKGAIASSLVILRGNPQKINCLYLLHCLDSKLIYKQQAKANNGSSQPNLSAASVKEFKIPLPPLEVQMQIAETLDKVQEIIDGHKKQLEELDNLIKAIFYDMFGEPVTNEKGWGVAQIKDLAKKIQYGTSEKASTNILEYPIIRMNNITYTGE